MAAPHHGEHAVRVELKLGCGIAIPFELSVRQGYPHTETLHVTDHLHYLGQERITIIGCVPTEICSFTCP
jgi:hypothetical protein